MKLCLMCNLTGKAQDRTETGSHVYYFKLERSSQIKCELLLHYICQYYSLCGQSLANASKYFCFELNRPEQYKKRRHKVKERNKTKQTKSPRGKFNYRMARLGTLYDLLQCMHTRILIPALIPEYYTRDHQACLL